MGPVSRPVPPPAPSPRGFGRGTSSVSARRHRVVWSGTARSSPSRPMTEPISPSVCRYASRNTALNVSAVRIARSEYSGCPPRLVRRSAFHASTASSENHTVKLPRRRRLSSYSRQFVTLRFCSGMWRRRFWFSLKGKAGIPGQTEGRPATSIGPRVPPVGSLQQRATSTFPPTAADWSTSGGPRQCSPSWKPHDPGSASSQLGLYWLARALTEPWATAWDGERIPVSVVHRRDLPLDGSAPCLLYGYGAYGWSVDPAFAVERLPLLEHGFVYAIAHVRGGAEKGQGWYRAGKLENRMNAFRDFLSAADALVGTGYTGRGLIVAQGRSAGGMLVGAALNMAPELFAGVLADVPFVDVLNTMLDEELPLTPPEWLEWGDPIRDAGTFVRIRSYSPYEQVRPEVYPPVLATAGLSDPRVTYWEPAKWILRLRDRTAGGLFLFRTELHAGHAGNEGRVRQLGERAREI